MMILSLSALLVFSQITFADSATQTDWTEHTVDGDLNNAQSV